MNEVSRAQQDFLRWTLSVTEGTEWDDVTTPPSNDVISVRFHRLMYAFIIQDSSWTLKGLNLGLCNKLAAQKKPTTE